MRKRWEYRTEMKPTKDILGLKEKDFLNQQGNEGWELVHIEVQYIDRGIVSCLHTYTFKREVL